VALTLNANALVDLNSTKLYLQIPLLEITQDEQVRDFINEVSSLVERYCRRKFIQETITERYNGTRIAEILLNHWPVTAIVAVHEDSNRVFDSDSLLDPSTYTIRGDEMQDGYYLERYDVIFARGQGTVQVEYTFGYPTFQTVPGDLQLATKRTIGYYFKQQQNKDFTQTNKSKGDENITLIDGIPKAAATILDFYQRLELPDPGNPIRNM
jgi:hypothetical protein